MDLKHPRGLSAPHWTDIRVRGRLRPEMRGLRVRAPSEQWAVYTRHREHSFVSSCIPLYWAQIQRERYQVSSPRNNISFYQLLLLHIIIIAIHCLVIPCIKPNPRSYNFHCLLCDDCQGVSAIIRQSLVFPSHSVSGPMWCSGLCWWWWALCREREDCSWLQLLQIYCYNVTGGISHNQREAN